MTMEIYDMPDETPEQFVDALVEGLARKEFLRFNKLAERNGWAFACQMGISFCNSEVILRYVKRLPDDEDNNERT